MNDDDRLDSALEALARPEPPPGHVSAILARTSSAGNAGAAEVTNRRLSSRESRRWLYVTAAAGVLAAFGLPWLAARTASGGIEDLLRDTAAVAVPAPRVVPDLNEPVLPPQAYWGIDAFEEFAALRPRVQTPGTTARQARGRTTDRPWAVLPPAPSGLPPIELEDISPAPVVIPPLASLEDIALADLSLAPIVMAPITEEERP